MISTCEVFIFIVSLNEPDMVYIQWLAAAWYIPNLSSVRSYEPGDDAYYLSASDAHTPNQALLARTMCPSLCAWCSASVSCQCTTVKLALSSLLTLSMPSHAGLLENTGNAYDTNPVS